ncbi:MAG: ATP-binding protein [Candidatus Iainarchaeum archaeon]|uniref:ATP-binding protein n=1 Tax=Candidatus Iainarchaeum sp. TaxID=3101447 RepID=A0A497JGF4_9ARCH|nr:MAG: ATP-binding protein [Candidatus Diapherotrites archaeon]
MQNTYTFRCINLYKYLYTIMYKGKIMVGRIDEAEIISYISAKLAEAPVLAREKTQKNGKPLGHRRAYSRIREYVDNFITGEKAGGVENRIIVLPGLRGVGKTTLMLQIYKYLALTKQIEQARILYFSVDELKEYLGVKISEVVKVYVERIFKTSFVNLDKQLFILIDEAHFDKDWGVAAKIIYDQTKKIFLLLTGSSALSMEMSVDLARRAKKETMFPLNFSEYLILKYKVFPPPGTAESIRGVIFNPSNTSLKYAEDNWNELKRRSLSIGKPLDKEFEWFLSSGGFPYGIVLDEKVIYEKIFSMIDRIIEKDIFVIRSFKTDTRNLITRIITFLALQKPGGTSDVKLAQRLNTSPTMVRSILDVLEKTHLIFSVKPYGGSGKIVRKPWKYYFLSPSVNAAIRYKLGRYNLRDRDMLGLFAETLVASYFFRMKETINMPSGLFYDAEKKGVDFLIQKGLDEVIPVEVSIGKKEKGQIKKAINKYKAKYGVVVCDIDDVRKEGDVVYLPITFFSFV